MAPASLAAFPGLSWEKRAGQVEVLYWLDLALWLLVKTAVQECLSGLDQRAPQSSVLSLEVAEDRHVRKDIRTGKGHVFLFLLPPMAQGCPATAIMPLSLEALCWLFSCCLV